MHVSIVQINNNGLLSFETPVRDYTPRDFPLKAEDSVRGVGVAFIAPFWADVDTRDGHGKVFFRSTTDNPTLALIKDVVSSSQAGVDLAARFNPKWALIATWEEVGYYDKKGDMVSRGRSVQPCQDSGCCTPSLWLPKPHLVMLCSPQSSLDDMHVQTPFSHI